MSGYITTYKGLHFDPENPTADCIMIEDIAHALSFICRGNGHVKSFWSVGEHCICCAKEAWEQGFSNRIVLACLLHDASECYLSDVPRPVKEGMPEYRKREKELLSIIYTKFLGSPLTEEEEKLVKEIDDALLWHDLANLLDEWPDTNVPLIKVEYDYTVRPFREVEEEYLELYYQFSGEEQPQPVYLDDIVDAFDSCMRDWSQYLNVKTGEIVMLSDEPWVRLVEDKDAELRKEIEESDDYICLPDQYELNEKQIMEDFADNCVRGGIGNRLWRALNSRHPYRYFKAAINETGVEKKYYAYRTLMFFRKAEEWCRENKVRYKRRQDSPKNITTFN